MNQSHQDKNAPRVGVSVLIVDDSGRVLLGLRKGSHGSGTWGAPGGHLEHGETIKGCASREVREETGLEVSDADFLAITEDIFEEEEKHYITVWVTCQKLKSAAKVECMEPLKCTEWSWLSLSDCQNSRAWSAATEEYHELFLPVQNLLKEQKHLVENIIKSMN